jgi:hypothetical protein
MSMRRTSGFCRVATKLSRFDRCMLRRAINSTICNVEKRPKTYMKSFGITSEDTLKRTVRSLERTKNKLGL